MALPMPVELTTATAAFDVDHVTAWPVMGLPLESFAVAVNCAESPTFFETEPGATVTVATVGAGGGGGGGGDDGSTSVCAAPLLPSDVAVSVAEPTPTARAKPVLSTVTAAGLLLAHVT